MKLKPKCGSKRTWIAEDRAYHRMMGIKYPISGMSARRLAHANKLARLVEIYSRCPN